MSNKRIYGDRPKTDYLIGGAMMPIPRYSGVGQDTKDVFLAYIRDQRTIDDNEIEGHTWDRGGDYDLYYIPIEEAALYIAEMTLTDSDPVIPFLSDHYAERLKDRIVTIMADVTSRSMTASALKHQESNGSRIDTILGNYAYIFTGDIVPDRFTVKTINEARRIIDCIDMFVDRYGIDLVTAAAALKKDKKHGKKQSKSTDTLADLKNSIKSICSKYLAIENKQRSDKITNKIITILTSN